MRLKAAFEEVKVAFVCGKHSNARLKAAFEEVKAAFVCGKH
ncbi:MAG: hypothetical protein V7K77_13000 [Nostoc sp.]